MSHDHKNSSGTKQTTPEEDNKEDRLSVHSNASQEHADDTNEKARESPVQADDTANQDASSHHSPEPNEQNHQDDDPDDDDADLQNYKQDEDPENFDSKSFLSSVSDLSEMLQADNLRHVDNDFPAKEIKSMVRRVSSTMDTFKNYAVYSQGKLEVVRDQMKEIRDRVHKRIQTKGYDPRSVTKQTPTPRKKQVRFAAKDDIIILKEVVARNPFEDSNRWVDVAESVNSCSGLSVDGRRTRERTRLLLHHFESEDTENLRKSGTEEEYGEKEQLLEDVSEMKRKEDQKSAELCSKKTKAAVTAQQNGALLRDAALNNLKRRAPLEEVLDDEDHDEQPVRGHPGQLVGDQPDKKRQRMSATDKVVNYLTAKSSSETDLRKQEIELKKEELALQRERFDLERQLRMADIEERKSFLDILKNKI